MSLLQYNFHYKTEEKSTFPINIDFNQDWIPLSAMFNEQMPKNSLFYNNNLSRLHEISYKNSFYGYKKSCRRSKLNLLVFPHMWAEIIDYENLKVLWSLMVHKNYVKQQIGSILTAGKLIPEYTQLHVRSEFSYYKYKSPTVRRSFMKNIYKNAEEEGIKIYEKNNFKDMFLNFTDHVKTLKELKQIKQTIIDGLQKTKRESTSKRLF